MKHAHTLRLRRFEPLSRLGDYRIERHEIDPRGWKVLSPDGRAIGEVKDVVVDTERMRARYLDVELDASAFDLHGDPRILVSMAGARPDGNNHRLIVDGFTAARVAELIEARDRHIEAFWERWWSGDPVPASATVAADPRIRPAANGRVVSTFSQDDLRSALEDVRPGEPVRIPVVEEEIVVERRPVTRGH